MEGLIHGVAYFRNFTVFAGGFWGGFHICVINDINTRKHTSKLITGENFYTVTEKIKLSDSAGVCLCTCYWKLGGGEGFPVTSALLTTYSMSIPFISHQL